MSRISIKSSISETHIFSLSLFAVLRAINFQTQRKVPWSMIMLCLQLELLNLDKETKFDARLHIVAAFCEAESQNIASFCYLDTIPWM